MLPFKLGIAQNQIDNWSLIQIFDISNVISEFNSIKEFYKHIRKTIDSISNAPRYNNELNNYYKIITTLENRIQTQLNQLNPLITTKNKRAIIDGLGSIIKSITGNLDHNDAQKYDEAILSLTRNQHKVKILVKDQISLLETSIQKFQNDTKILSHNQKILGDRISKLETSLKMTQFRNIDTYQYITLEMVVSQLSGTLRIMYEILERIENAITFSKIGIFHNSIIEPNDLFEELFKANKHLNEGKSKFPFEISIQNILYFEKIIKIKSYSKGNQIIFVLEIPIVEAENYNLYHLYSLPIISQNTFKAIIPYSKYLLLNEQNFALFNLHCQEIKPNEFLCQELHLSKVNAEAPCEVQLLRYSKGITNCLQAEVEVTETKVQKLKRNQWIVIVPETTLAKQKCGKNQDNIPLNGTYLIELSNDCEIWVKDILLKSYQNSKPQFKNIELPKLNLNFNLNSETYVYEPKKIHLSSINLDETRNFLSVLKNQKRKIDSLSDVPIYFGQTSFWTIMLYILIAFAALYALYRYKTKKGLPSTRTHSEEIQRGLQEIHSALNHG